MLQVLGDDTYAYPNFIGVDRQQFEKEFEQIVFSMLTLYEVDEAKYRGFTEGIEPKPPEGAEVPQFYLEKYLQEFIVTNWEVIFGGELELVGAAYQTADAGEIDMLARDRSTGSHVVIELKKGLASSIVIGQTLGYMGWVRDNLSATGEDVRGMIICRERDSRLDYALRMVPQIKVKYYKADFHLFDEPQA